MNLNDSKKSLTQYIRRGGHNIRHIKKLIDRGANPAAHGNKPIIHAAEHGNLSLVKFLLTYPEVKPFSQGNSAIIRASANGHLHMVKFLSTLDGVKAYASGNDAFYAATAGGHLEVVKFLSTLPDVVSFFAVECDWNSYIVESAAINGYLDIVKFLCTIPGIDASLNNNQAIKKAIKGNYLEIVKFLLTLPKVYARAQRTTELMKYAAQVDNLEMIKIISDIPNTCQAEAVDLAFIEACIYGRLRIVKFLIRLPGIEGFVLKRNNCALMTACAQNHREIVEFLLTLPGIDVNVDDGSPFWLARTPIRAMLYYTEPKIKEYLNTQGRLLCSSIGKGLIRCITPTLHLIAITLTDLPTPLIIEILDQSLDIAIYIPYHIKWNMVVKIKHSKCTLDANIPSNISPLRKIFNYILRR